MDDKQYYDNHYAEMSVQPIEVMQEILSVHELQGALLFNVNKYDMRAGHKSGEAYSKDIAKRDRYIEWLFVAASLQRIDPKLDYEVPDSFKNDILTRLQKEREEIAKRRK